MANGIVKRTENTLLSVGRFFSVRSLVTIFIFDLISSPDIVLPFVGVVLAPIVFVLVFLIEFLRFSGEPFFQRIFQGIIKGLIAGIIVSIPTPLTGIFALIWGLYSLTFDKGDKPDVKLSLINF